MMKFRHVLVSSLVSIAAAAAGSTVRDAQAAESLTIATVNNSDMIVMQGLSKTFEQQNPDITLRWVTLEENTLRQRVTTDIATQSGQLDIVTVGLYEVPIWSRLGWLAPFDNIPQTYQVSDIFPSLRNGLAHDGVLYSLPFYAESTFTMYRTDLFKSAGLTMPEKPTWSQIGAFAKTLNDPQHGVYGICLRGKPGWGENMGQISEIANSFGGRYFDMKWKPQFTSPEWMRAVTFYVDLLKKYGPPGEVTGGYNENLTTFAGGKCAMWVDATVSASFLADPKQSQVAGKVGYAQAPYETTKTGSNYLWAWTLAIPKTTKHLSAAQKFIYWATSPDYIKLVAAKKGWAAVPPGTRMSTYKNPDYLKAAPFAPVVLKALEVADVNHPSSQPVPYSGISYVGIPEWQGIGQVAGQAIASALAGNVSVSQALETAQRSTTRTMTQAGYYK